MAVPFEQTVQSLNRDSILGYQVLISVGVVLFLVWLVFAWFLPLPLTLESVEGRIVSANEPTRVVVDATERIETLFVRVGDNVRKGEPLINFVREAQELELQSLRGRLQKIERQIADTRDELEYLDQIFETDHDLLLNQAETNQVRIKQSLSRQTYNNEAVSIYKELRSERRIDELKFRETQKVVEQEAEELRALKIETRRIETAQRSLRQNWQLSRSQLQQRLSQFSGSVQELEPKIMQVDLRIRELALYAPHSGVIEGMAQVSVGQTLPANSWLMTISPQGEYQFEASFRAKQAAGRISAGDVANVNFYALPWTEYGSLEATVIRVGNESISDLIKVQFQLDQDASLAKLTHHGLEGRAVVEVDSVTLLQRLKRLIGRTG